MGQVSPLCVTTSAIFLIFDVNFFPKNRTMLVQVIIFLSHSNFCGWVLSKGHVNTFVKVVVLELYYLRWRIMTLWFCSKENSIFFMRKLKEIFFFCEWKPVEYYGKENYKLKLYFPLKLLKTLTFPHSLPCRICLCSVYFTVFGANRRADSKHIADIQS